MTKKKIFVVLLSILLVVAAAPFVVLFVSVGKEYGEEYLSRVNFDSDLWQNDQAINREPYPRLRMVDNLLKKHNLNGKDHNEIITLLGKPEETPYFKEYEIVYWLGPERNFISIDSEWLVININEKGIVDEYHVFTD